jgi:hypothetical protein
VKAAAGDKKILRGYDANSSQESAELSAKIVAENGELALVNMRVKVENTPVKVKFHPFISFPI